MSQGKDYLHSHSQLELEMKIPKYFVLVDLEYKDRFDTRDCSEISFKKDGVVLTYLKVRTLDFVKAGGAFKNLNL